MSSPPPPPTRSCATCWRRDLGARDVVVGYDFSFGRGRAGDAGLLAQLGASLGIDVAVIQPVAIGDTVCSSTRIRELVAAGDTVGAARLLGRPFELEGPVVRGAGRGRGLGFPTANVAAEGELRPALGIYAGRRARAGRSAGGPGPPGGAQRRPEPDVSLPRQTSASKRTCWISKTISTIGGCASRSASDCATS